MTSKYAKGKIRDFELTMEDAALVAECYNSFDDSDSWPGGFTHGNPFTAERIFEAQEKNDDIRVLVAYADDKIVGYCNVCEGFYDSESAYVGLLGVNPHYQGQGFGKALLIEAAETAARAGKRRIDLHTWGGNLKALPLYKRVGYNWMPGTRVLMESHIPGILSFPLFHEFFERYYWYDAFKREIRQEPDDLVIEGIGLFQYAFEGKNGDFLRVMVDREAKGICGFEMTLDGKTLSVQLRPSTHRGYIGIGEVPVTLTITNDTSEQIQYSINIIPTKSLIVKTPGLSSGVIKTNDHISMRGKYKIPFGVAPLDKDKAADEKVKSYAEWRITIDGETVSLFAGLIPTEPVRLTSTPEFPSIFLGGSTDIAVGIYNNTDDNLDLRVVITPEEGSHVDEVIHRISLESKQSKEIDVLIHDKGGTEKFLKLNISVYKIDDGEVLVNRKIYSIPREKAGGVFAYEPLGDFIVLENDETRFLFTNKVPITCQHIERKKVRDYLSGWLFGISLGLPFPREGDEWTRKDLDIVISNTPDYAEITITGDSDNRPGLRYTQRYRLYANTDYLDISATLTNIGSEPIANLGLCCSGWLDYWLQEMTVPIDDGIARFQDPSWIGSGLPRKPEYYHESWISMYESTTNTSIGFIWETKHLDKIFLSSNIPRPEYRLPVLNPGESRTYPILKAITKQGDWRVIRSLWAEVNSISLEKNPPKRIIDELSVELFNPAAKIESHSGAPLLVDKSELNEVELRIKVLRENPIKGHIHLTAPEGILINGESDYDLEIECGIDTPVSQKLTITAQDGDWLRTEGEISLSFMTHIVRRPLSVVVFDSRAEMQKESDSIDGQNLYAVKSKDCSVEVSPQHRGSMVRYTRPDGKSVLLDRFPDSGPFVWWDRFFSGLSPIVSAQRVWDWETKFNREEWSIGYKEIGPWVGYEVTSHLEHSLGISGITINASYLLLKGTNLVQAKIEAKNNLALSKSLRLGFKASPRLDDSTLSKIHTCRLGKSFIHEPIEMRTSFKVDGDESWLAFEDSVSEDVLGVISTEKRRVNLAGETISDKAQLFRILDMKKLKPGESKSLTCYLVITASPHKVELLKNLSEITE
ncbi:MAG: dTDP-fucosamine acetyltransferase [Candidatus Thorarchaeota archaeon]|nr:MAG: dTDP-fucosamine acetyltransferase [Candidatus Thorarchaeota archaeon]